MYGVGRAAIETLTLTPPLREVATPLSPSQQMICNWQLAMRFVRRRLKVSMRPGSLELSWRSWEVRSCRNWSDDEVAIAGLSQGNCNRRRRVYSTGTVAVRVCLFAN